MHVLAIETSGAGSVALADGPRVLAERRLEIERRQTQLLVPTIRELLDTVGWSVADLQLVAVSIGPGSYTGLRVGVTCAKTLAYAAGIEVIAVSTLEAIACNAAEATGPICVVSDAQRGDVYWAEFRRTGPDEFEVVHDASLARADRWAAQIPAAATVLGPGLRRYRSVAPDACQVLPEETWDPRASAVAQIAGRAFRAGRRDSLWSLQPLYLRKSAAEEKWEQRAGR